MAKVAESVTVDAPPGTVWEIVSDLDGEPAYWKGTKSVKNVSCEGNTVRREITIAFRNKKCMQTVRLHPPDRIDFEFTGGIIKGSKTVTLAADGDGTILAAEWDVRLGGMMGMFSGAITGHIKEGTRQALKAIKGEAEGRES